MRILLTNDDGIASPGIQTLAEILKERHHVCLVAPDRERSTVAHALTLHKPLRAEPVRLLRRVLAWRVNGTPSDCVKLGLAKLIRDPVDFVVSGINAGPNLGFDILYSGTVAGAMEGCFYGLPSLAVSVAFRRTKAAFLRAARFTERLLAQAKQFPLPPHSFLNVNIPEIRGKKRMRVEWTRLSQDRYDDIVEERKDLSGRSYFWLAGEVRAGRPAEAGSDLEAVRRGRISVTPVQYHLTHESFRRDLAKRVSLRWV